jgi:hypothetical protein
MHVIRTDSDLEALENPELQALIRQRIADTAEYVDHFSELVYFVIVEAGDDITDVDASLGFTVMANRFDGIRFGQVGFMPSWDVMAEHAGWFELVYVLSDDGNGVTVFVSRTQGTPPELLVMCRAYAVVEADT